MVEQANDPKNGFIPRAQDLSFDAQAEGGPAEAEVTDSLGLVFDQQQDPLVPTRGSEFDHSLLEDTMKSGTDISIPESIQPNVIFFPSTDSTMREPLRHLERTGTLEPGLIFVAGAQTEATGQDGRWFTGPSDVAMTVILPDIQDHNKLAQLTFAAGISVINALRESLGDELPQLKVKWPNDVFEPKNAQKLCGILSVGGIEEEKRAGLAQKGYELPPNVVVIGIGVNLGSEVIREEELRGKPTSIQTLTGVLLDREAVIANIYRELISFYELITSTPIEFTKHVKPNLYLGENDATYMDISPDDETIHGTLKGVSQRFFELRSDGVTRLIPLSIVRRMYPDPKIREH